MISKTKQSIAGIIRQNLPFIEQQMDIGVSQETLLQTLGLNTTLTNFRSELYRARKWRNEKQAKSPPKPPQNRSQPLRQGVGITEPEKTPQKCDFAKQLNSFKLEDLVKGSNGK